MPGFTYLINPTPAELLTLAHQAAADSHDRVLRGFRAGLSTYWCGQADATHRQLAEEAAVSLPGPYDGLDIYKVGGQFFLQLAHTNMITLELVRQLQPPLPLKAFKKLPIDDFSLGE